MSDGAGTEGSRQGSDGDRFFFVHLQKTGGTSFWMHLRRAFPPAELYPNPDEPLGQRTVDVDALVREWPSRMGTVRVVAGHFPICTVERLEGDFRTFTLLRDPVERILSSLRAHRQRVPGLDDTSLEDIYSFAGPARQVLLRNHMVRMLGFEQSEMTHGAQTPAAVTSDHLARAEANLEAMEVVGFCEDFPGFLASVETAFGWKLGRQQHGNKTQPMEVSDAFRARLLEENALDAALYAHARSVAPGR